MTAERPKLNAAAVSAPAEAEAWRTAREWAAMGLPGLPRTKSGIIRLAARMGWAFRPAPVANTRLPPLPADTRAAALAREAAEATQAIVLPATPAATGALPGWRRRRMEARLAILDWIEADALVLGWHRKAREAFAARAKAGLLDDPFPRLLATAAARRGEPGARKISLGTLIRWRPAFADYKAAGAPKEEEAAGEKGLSAGRRAALRREFLGLRDVPA